MTAQAIVRQLVSPGKRPMTLGPPAHLLQGSLQQVRGAQPPLELRSALNASQAQVVWLRKDGGLWVAGDGPSKMNVGISGRALAEALYRFVGQSDRYAGGVFHDEDARDGCNDYQRGW